MSVIDKLGEECGVFAIYDPDGDGLYQNKLNTWISDGHNYHGAGCAQSTAYNYRANRVLARIAKRIGRDDSRLEARAEKIRGAMMKSTDQTTCGAAATRCRSERLSFLM